MIPSFKRPILLMQAIESFRKTAQDPKCHQVIVRLQTNDPDAEKTKTAVLAFFENCKVIIGEPMRGYIDVDQFYNEMLPLCEGEFINIWDDDMTIEGGQWDVKLREAPKGVMVLCQRYQCGPSLYDPGSCDGPGIGWFINQKQWRETGESEINFPPDVYMTKVAARFNWPKWHLGGITLNHNWQRPQDGDR